MPPINIPLRWEITGDQWWFVSPIDYAAANGHYELVRELLHIDINHLIKLTSLRRIQRLETLWDDEEERSHEIAKNRAYVARKLFLECESTKQNKMNSLIHSGNGGWLIYMAASAGNVGFVRELLQSNPLLVFGEGEYGVTDIFYGAARSKSCEVFRLLYVFAMTQRSVKDKNGDSKKHSEEICDAYRFEIMNRGVHAAARGGNVEIMKDLLVDCVDVLGYRDQQGCTVLHAAAGKGKVEVVEYLVESFDIINSTDNQGNTALHTAAYKGQAAVINTLISVSPSLISRVNNFGETYLHTAMAGFRAPFRRLDKQKQFMKQIIDGEGERQSSEIINAKNNHGRTALHMAIIENVHSELVQLLLSHELIQVNVSDFDSMTPLDYLRQRRSSAATDILTRRLVAAGGISSCMVDERIVASELKNQRNGSYSPGTLFRVSDSEIIRYTGFEKEGPTNDEDSKLQDIVSFSTESSQFDSSSNNTQSSSISSKPSSIKSAVKRLKRVFHWLRIKDEKDVGFKKPIDGNPTPLGERLSKPSSMSSSVSSSPFNNKQTVSDTSTKPSHIAKNHPTVLVSSRKYSSSLFAKSSSFSVDKQKGIVIEGDHVGPSCSNKMFRNEQLNIEKRVQNHQYICFGDSSLSFNNPIKCSQSSTIMSC